MAKFGELGCSLPSIVFPFDNYAAQTFVICIISIKPEDVLTIS